MKMVPDKIPAHSLLHLAKFPVTVRGVEYRVTLTEVDSEYVGRYLRAKVYTIRERRNWLTRLLMPKFKLVSTDCLNDGVERPDYFVQYDSNNPAFDDIAAEAALNYAAHLELERRLDERRDEAAYVRAASVRKFHKWDGRVSS